jgi:putative ABC transport system substrate-binding protein
MRRREFITLGSGAAIAWPIAARAQQPTGRIYRIGFLAGGARPIPIDSDPYRGFLRGMREHGYVEAKDFIMEWRFAEGRVDVFPELVSELVRLNVDVIVLGTPVAVPAAQRATTTIPIVMADSTDPVARGYVASLSHPGGNITGQASSREEITLKQLELLRLSVPGLSRIGLAVNPNNSGHFPLMRILDEPARRLDVALVPVEMQKPEEIATTFGEMIERQVGAILFRATRSFFLTAGNLPILRIRRDCRRCSPTGSTWKLAVL